jgi:hypothetical protein
MATAAGCPTGMAEDFQPLIAEYRAGLDAELALLRQLESLAAGQQVATADDDPAAMRSISDERERVMTTLVSLEHDLQPVRATLAEQRERLQDSPTFRSVSTLHNQAAAMVSRILASDEESLRALQDAEHARRDAVNAMERGETTLQAYRRVVAPPSSNATLVDRRG